MSQGNCHGGKLKKSCRINSKHFFGNNNKKTLFINKLFDTTCIILMDYAKTRI